MAIDDSLMRAKSRSNSSFRDLLDHPGVPPDPPAAEDTQEAGKKADPLPLPGEPYRPHARFLNRLQQTQVTLHFVSKDCTYRGFPYSHYDRMELAGDKAGGGLVLAVRFSGSVTTEVRIEGRNLRDVYLNIASNTMPWVWERPDGIDHEPDNATVISKITFTDIER